MIIKQEIGSFIQLFSPELLKYTNLFWLTLYPNRDGSTQMGNKGSAVGALKP
jgi:hypothetical protein